MPDFRYARHLARVYNAPLLISEAGFDAMAPVIEHVLRGGLEPDTQALVTAPTKRSESGLRVTEAGVCLISVSGVLVHRGQYDAECNYLLGYQDVARMLSAALADPAVKAIALVIDSPGGEVSGVFELASMIYEARDTKPIHAIANDAATSAAYLIGSAASSLSSTRTALTGSIGVLMRHVDISKWLKAEGYVVTLLTSRAQKADGNPYEALRPEVRARMQARIDHIDGMLIDAISTYRGLSAKALAATEAGVFLGHEALDLGLVDRLETPDQLILRLSDDSRGAIFLATTSAASAIPQSEDPAMPIEKPAAQTSAAPPQNPEGAAPTSAAAAPAAAAPPAQDVASAAAAAERDRIFAILEHPEAQGRHGAAVALAKVSAMSAEQAGAVLASLPKQSAPVADNQFARLMTAMGNPDVGPGSGEDADEHSPQAIAASWDYTLKRVGR